MEIWKDILGYEGLYQISNKGNVKSKAKTLTVNGRYGSYSKSTPEILLSPKCANKGYRIVTLSKENKKKSFYIHRLVLSHFEGPPPIGKNSGCHKDSNPNNNKIENLYWGSQKENMRDCIKAGRMSRGSKVPSAILDEKTVIEIKRYLLIDTKSGRINRAASKFGVSKHVISLIKLEKTWSHVNAF